MEINRAKLNEAQEAVAEGLLRLSEAIVLEAASVVHDAPPHGTGLLDAWGYAAYVDRRKIGDGSADDTPVAKPRASRLGKQGLSAIAGFGFPGRFEEMGTVDTPSHPFLTPAVMRIVPRAVSIIREGAARRLSQP